MAAVKKKNTCGDTKYTLQDTSSGASIFLGGLEAAERACKSNEHMSASSSASRHSKEASRHSIDEVIRRLRAIA